MMVGMPTVPAVIMSTVPAVIMSTVPAVIMSTVPVVIMPAVGMPTVPAMIMGRIFVVIIHFKFLLMLNDDVNDIRIVLLDNCNPLLLLRKIFSSLIFFLVDLYHRSLKHDLQ